MDCLNCHPHERANGSHLLIDSRVVIGGDFSLIVDRSFGHAGGKEGESTYTRLSVETIGGRLLVLWAYEADRCAHLPYTAVQCLECRVWVYAY